MKKSIIILNYILLITAFLIVAGAYTYKHIQVSKARTDIITCGNSPLMTSCVVKEISTQKGILKDKTLYMDNKGELEEVTIDNFFVPKSIYFPDDSDFTNCYKTTRLYTISAEETSTNPYPTALINRCNINEELINYFYIPYIF